MSSAKRSTKRSASVSRSTTAKRRNVLWLRLYVAGHAPNSVRALDHLRALMGTLETEPRLEVIDVLDDPALALERGILVTPTLVRERPLPAIRIIGDLADRDLVLAALGLTAALGRP